MAYYDLESVRKIVKEATGLDIMYAYDDLVFPEHAAFIMQYDKTDSNHYHCFFHKDCNTTESETIFKTLSVSCYQHQKTIELNGNFDLSQKGKEVEIRFL